MLLRKQKDIVYLSGRLQEKNKDTKEVIRIRISKQDRQRNDQK